MMRPNEIQRAILVVLDGLRPDAIDRFDLCNIRQLAEISASTMRARTVSPSLTWPALTSLLTGVAPTLHGIVADSAHLPTPKTKLQPLPTLLRLAGYRTSAFMGDIPFVYRSVGSSIARNLGFDEARFSGAVAFDVLRAARKTIDAQRHGLIFLHWVDADRAGHEHGWMSEPYGDAVRHLDFALGMLMDHLDLENSADTMLVALGDHGGGGLDPRHHEGDHPLNATIPVMFANATIEPRPLGEVSLLDVPTSIAWSLGVQPPASYAGRVVIRPLAARLESAVA